MRDDKNEDYHDYSRVEYDRERSGTGWFVGIIVGIALLAIGYLVFSANQPEAAQPVAATITNIEPSKKNLGASIAQCLENDGMCISKELILSD
jgi:hypothetical protein